MIQSDI